jgi:hypothetical protein
MSTEVDQAAEVVLGADRDLRGDDVRTERVLERVEGPEEVGPLAVEHVHVDEAGHAELGRALPQALGADFHAHDGVDHEDGGLADAQGAQCVGDERWLAGGVDQVDLDVAPLERGQRRGDRHPAGLLVLVGVRDRGAVRHRAESGGRAGLEQQSLVQRRLPAPPVADQRHVADPFGGMGHGRDSSPRLPLPRGGDGAGEVTPVR